MAAEMNTPVVDPPAAEPSASGLPGSQTSEGPTQTPEPASPNAFRRKKLLKFFKTGGGRVGLCACAAALVVAVAIVVLLIRGGNGGKALSGWPDDELLAGVASPEQGEVLSVRTTESALTVYLAEFPADGLDGYLQTLGIPSDGGSPYIAQLDGERLLAVVYDADARRLSLTVTKTS